MVNWQAELATKVRGAFGKVARGLLTRAHLDGPARRLRTRILRRGGAHSQFSLLVPIDWFTGGPTPRLYAATKGLSGLPTAQIFTYREYSANRPDKKPFTELKFRPTTYSGLLRADCTQKLPNDDYVIVARSVYGNVLSVSAFKVRHRVDYDQLIAERMEARKKLPTPAEKILFSVTTTVWNTDTKLVEELFQDLSAQTYRRFEWLVLDNGSTAPDVVRYLADLAKRTDWVRVSRVEGNIHIIPGNRMLLEKAKGDFIVPVDSDDALYPDSLARFAAEIDDRTQLLYSDEQKIAPDRHPVEILWRQSWSRLLAQATCPSAHLMTFRRETALAIDVYGDDYAKGCHDWDSVLRFSDAGHVPKRVPEVLYGWRIHGGSTAGSDTAKDYIRESQLRNLREMIHRNGWEDRFETTPLEQLGYYHLTRKRRDAKHIEVFVVPSPDAKYSVDEAVERLKKKTRYPDFNVSAVSDVAQLNELIRAKKGLVAVIGAHLRPTNVDWLWEALGTLELDSHTALTGGQILTPDAKIAHLGYVGGMRGFFGTPFFGGESRDLVFPLRIRRNVSAVYGSFVVFRADAVANVGGFTGLDSRTGNFGIELSERLRRNGDLVGWTPTMAAECAVPLEEPHASDALRASPTIFDDPYYSQMLSLDPDRYGEVVTPAERDAILKRKSGVGHLEHVQPPL